MSRRAIEQRKRKSQSRRQVDNLESVPNEQSARAVEIPDRWLLIPQETSLYDWQTECLARWIECGRGTVKVATGAGKTHFALAAAQRLQNERVLDLRLVVVVPTIPLMNQWREEMRGGNLPDSAIALMGGGNRLPPLTDVRVLICVLNSARERLAAEIAKFEWQHRMLLIVDECHRANATQARRIFEAKPAYTLGLSATPEQEHESDEIAPDELYNASDVGQALGPIIFEFAISDALRAGLLAPFEVWHIGLMLRSNEAEEYAEISHQIRYLRRKLHAIYRASRSRQPFLAWCQRRASQSLRSSTVEAQQFINLTTGRKRLLYNADARTELTLSILSQSSANSDRRVIVFHESIADIEALFLSAIDQDIQAVLEHSQLPDTLRMENIEAFRNGIANVVISARSLIEGFNVPAADLGIITASSGSVRQRIQSLGRVLRRKPGEQHAKIIVLYIRDTEDEAIYEKADWENVIGADLNRYFEWSASSEGEAWELGLSETRSPPRIYKPSSWEIDAETLESNDIYPARPDGVDLRIDQECNLRTDSGMLLPVSRNTIQKVLDLNPYRRARYTAAGHLIVRVDRTESKYEDWRFLSNVEIPPETDDRSTIRLRIRERSGRRIICFADKNKSQIERIALGPGDCSSPESGMARDQLLEWIQSTEANANIKVLHLYWNGKRSYWLEIWGQKTEYLGELPCLEFSA